MDHIPTPPGESSENPELEYGELRSGRPEAGIRFPRDPDEEPHRDPKARESAQERDGDPGSAPGSDDRAGES